MFKNIFSFKIVFAILGFLFIYSNSFAFDYEIHDYSPEKFTVTKDNHFVMPDWVDDAFKYDEPSDTKILKRYFDEKNEIHRKKVITFNNNSYNAKIRNGGIYNNHPQDGFFAKLFDVPSNYSGRVNIYFNSGWLGLSELIYKLNFKNGNLDGKQHEVRFIGIARPFFTPGISFYVSTKSVLPITTIFKDNKLIFTTYVSTSHRTVQERHLNGHMKYSASINGYRLYNEQGQRHGRQCTYADSAYRTLMYKGKIISMCGQFSNYINGKLEGELLQFYKSGKLKLKLNYVNDEREGELVAYYESGKVKHRINYKNGERHGLFRYWYENGQLSAFFYFKDDKKEGFNKNFYKDGSLWVYSKYENDKVIHTKKFKKEGKQKDIYPPIKPPY